MGSYHQPVPEICMLECGAFIGKEHMVVVTRKGFLYTQLCRKGNTNHYGKKDKCSREVCSLCSSNISGRQHAHPQKWFQTFLIEVAVLMICVCKACEVNVRQCLKKKANGEPYKLRWQKTNVEMLHSCMWNKSSADNHPFSLQEIFDIIGTSPECDPDSQKPLCIWYYKLVYRHKNASRVQDITCCVCGTKRKHEHSSSTEASVAVTGRKCTLFRFWLV